MARIHKFEAFLVDVNEEFETADDLVEYINNTLRCGKLEVFNMETSKDIEWDDDLDINKYDCDRESLEKYF